MRKYDCKCSHRSSEHRLEADADGAVGSCTLCSCERFERADAPYFPKFTQ